MGDVAGIVLAAGMSSRMGHNKMLAELAGETIVRRSARTAIAAGLSPVVIVLGHQAELVGEELRDLPILTTVAMAPAGPTSGSLHTGLEQLGDVDAVIVMLADMVLTSVDMIAAMLETFRRTGAPVVASRYGRTVAPPFLFHQGLFGELLSLEGGGVGRRVVKAHRAVSQIIEWDKELLLDVDTAADLERAKRLRLLV